MSELVKAALHRGESPQLHFWRTATGVEVDVLAQTWEDGGERLVPIEVKTSATASARMAAGVTRLRQDLGALVAPGYVVFLGDRQLPLGGRMTALPLGEL